MLGSTDGNPLAEVTRFPEVKKLDHMSSESLVRGAIVLAEDRFGDRVFDLKDGRILKLFRRKRLHSPNIIFPHARPSHDLQGVPKPL